MTIAYCASAPGSEAVRPLPPLLETVDSLRGLAIALVVLVHAQALAPALGGGLLATFAASGSKGVQLFFVVSAFTLARSLDHRRMEREPNLYQNYFLRRFFRVAPLFYFVLLFNLFTLGLEPRFWAPDGLSAWDIMLAILFLNAWSPNAINSVIDGGWSIAVEANFYLALPLILIFVTNLKRSLLFLFFSLMCGLMASEVLKPILLDAFPQKQNLGSFFKFWLPSQLFVFAIGVTLVHLPKPKNDDVLNARTSGLLLVVTCLCFVFVTKSFVFKCACIGVVTYLIMHYPARLFVNSAFIRLGQLSYSIYFIHFLILRACVYFEFSFKDFSPGLGFALAFAALLALSSAGAYVTWRCIEMPFIRLGSVIVSRRRRAHAEKIISQPAALPEGMRAG